MNSFPALYGSLEQIHLGPPKSSVEGSSEVPPACKVPPRFQQRLCFSSTDPSWAANSFRLKRLYGIRRDCRADPFWGAKSCVWEWLAKKSMILLLNSLSKTLFLDLLGIPS